MSFEAGCRCKHEKPKAFDKPIELKKEEKEAEEDKLSVTYHIMNVNGRPLRYTATAGYMPVKDEKGKVKGKIFHISYVRDGVANKTDRPVTFAFNGGPGSCSTLVHFAMGPKRADMTDEGEAKGPVYRLVTNEQTWLEFTDLVIIDPIDTGYSRNAEDAELKDFFGVKEDVKAIGEFIRLWVTKNERWESPKFLAGESYGGTRAVGLLPHLQQDLCMNINGVILLSSVVHFQTIRFGFGNDLPYVLFLPSYTATAWYHKKLPADLQKDRTKALEEAEKFAIGEYFVALSKGDALSEDEKQKVARKVARLTGVSEDYIYGNNLRLSFEYRKELLKDENKTVGRYDARLKGIQNDPASDSPSFDPSDVVTDAPFITAANAYIREVLNYRNDIPYVSMSSNAGKMWNWASGAPEGEGGYVNLSEMLRTEMSRNKFLNVFFSCGYYDLATPYFAAKFTSNHLHLDPEIKDNVTFGFYDAGHMMYIHKPSRLKLRADIESFFNKALAWKA